MSAQRTTTITIPIRSLLLTVASTCLLWSSSAGADSEITAKSAPATALYVTRPTNADQDSTAYVWQMVNAAYQSLDIELVPIDVPLARMYVMADQGAADAALAGVAEQIEPRYTNLIRVPVPVFESRYHIYGFDRNNSVNSWVDLGTETIAAIRGFETIKRYLPQEQIIWVNSAEQLLGMLEKKRVRYVVGLENQMTAELAQTMRPTSKLVRRLNDAPLHEVVLYHYLAPRHAGLREALAEAIEKEKAKDLIDGVDRPLLDEPIDSN
ncbi:hypothetical protein [Allohahella marinimesophila]|uniref:Uncharacterized protein n=1 Tax=Allohahella marinimesophila TaxID=1054972 RepID=A0ABP7Q4Z2_9GAMM